MTQPSCGPLLLAFSNQTLFADSVMQVHPRGDPQVLSRTISAANQRTRTTVRRRSNSPFWAGQDRHPDKRYLADLVSRHGVPAGARAYVAGRIAGEIAPRGRHVPLPPSDHWSEEDDAGANSGLAPGQYIVLARVKQRHVRYAAFETAQKPRAANLRSQGQAHDRRAATLAAKRAARLCAPRRPSAA